MGTVKKIASLVALVLFVASCGASDDDATLDTSTTTAPMGTNTTVPQSDEPLQIDVTVGEDSSPDRIELVEVGTSVRITLTNPTAEDEYHLHGYDIVTKKVAPGMPASISFTADEAGTFELESHVTNDVLVVLEIS